MAGQNKARGGNAQDLEDLARDIYVRLVTGPQRTGRTFPKLAADSREAAAAFYSAQPAAEAALEAAA